MNYEYAALTDTGRTRVNNEDSVAVDPATGLAVLADGMGGYNAGEVASGMATSFITTELGRWLSQAEGRVLPRDIKRAMEICVENANTSIFNSACSNPDYSGMGNHAGGRGLSGSTSVPGPYRRLEMLPVAQPHAGADYKGTIRCCRNSWTPD
jgi:serine/threonine protein phosphatase PrpC